MNDMSEEREDDVLLFVIGTIEEMIDKEFITGPKILTKDGIAKFHSLKEEGFTITDDERLWALSSMRQAGMI